MTQLIHRAFLATLATGAVVASGAFGVPAHAAPAPDMYGPPFLRSRPSVRVSAAP